MRTIKFRGKRIDNGEWGYGHIIINKNGDAFIKDTDYNVNNGKIDLIPRMVDPSTVGQFTELLDKNGKEIYEGDIVKDMLGEGVVEYFTPYAAFCVHIVMNGTVMEINDGNNWSIIGNIHDNPELLK